MILTEADDFLVVDSVHVYPFVESVHDLFTYISQLHIHRPCAPHLSLAHGP